MQIETKKLIKGCMIAILLYFLSITVFYLVAGDALYYRQSRGAIHTVEGNAATNEITKGSVVEQSFVSNIDYFEGFTVRLATFGRSNTGDIIVRLIDTNDNEILIEKVLDISLLQDSVFTTITLDKIESGRRGHVFKIQLTSNLSYDGSAVSAWYKTEESLENGQLSFNGQPINGVLCFDTIGKDIVWTGDHYWPIMVSFGIALLIYCIYIVYKNSIGKRSLVTYILIILSQYRFLIKQLVARDFKVKYKRSFLGMLWSFLNPLLTMSVQYMVFSTVFKADIEYYPVYLLSGIVLFNFFQESTNQALYSIVGNANLITKVYVPKYIYPITKVLSSTVNLIIALLPLLIMIIVTGVPIKISYILLLYILVILFVFSVGIGFILSAAMVFFRDIQFIWSVLSLLWMYATPIFYPESIFPEQFLIALKINPLYYFIKFARIALLEGISPEPVLYVQCAGYAILSLVIGIVVFKKSQDRFILYI